MSEQIFPVRIFGFKTEYRKNRQGELVPTDVVIYGCGTDERTRSETKTRIRDLERVEQPHPGSNNEAQKLAWLRWQQIEPHYKAWKEDLEAPVNGTPLELWPGVTAEQAEVLRGFGIRTVEAVRDMSDGYVAKLPFPNVRDLKTAAKYFLENHEKSQVATQMAALKERETELQSQLEEMRQIVLDMQAERETKVDKPKRGRGPKVKEPAEEATA